MKVRVFENESAVVRAAAATAGARIRDAISARGTARFLAGTGRWQLETLDALARLPGLAWGNVELFQVGEFVGLSLAHPASTRKRLFDRFINPTRLGRYHLLDGERDPEGVSRVEGAQLHAGRIDVAIIGVGENGRVAFHEPPADFQSEKPYLVVQLGADRRQRLVHDGWFTALGDAPDRAICVSLRQLLKADALIVIAAGAHLAGPIKRCLEGPVSPFLPASILRTHPDATLCLDPRAAALLATNPDHERDAAAPRDQI